jgi:hypothetical protein
MKYKIIVFTIATLFLATLAVAHVPQFPSIAPTTGVLNLQDIIDSDGKPADLSKRELICSDLVAFAFPEVSQSGLLVEQSGDSDVLLRTFYPEEGFPQLRTRGRNRWGLSDYTQPGDQGRGIARLDRLRRNQTIQEQSRVLYNICKTPMGIDPTLLDPLR